MKTTKSQKRIRRHNRLRAKVAGTAARPRIAVFKSNRFIYAQVIDDKTGTTLGYVSDYSGKKTKPTKALKTGKAKAAGEILGEALKKKGIDTVVFDRGGFKYHGRVKALADGLRDSGIKL